MYLLGKRQHDVAKVTIEEEKEENNAETGCVNIDSQKKESPTARPTLTGWKSIKNLMIDNVIVDMSCDNNGRRSTISLFLASKIAEDFLDFTSLDTGLGIVEEDDDDCKNTQEILQVIEDSSFGLANLESMGDTTPKLEGQSDEYQSR